MSAFFLFACNTALAMKSGQRLESMQSSGIQNLTCRPPLLRGSAIDVTTCAQPSARPVQLGGDTMAAATSRWV